MQMQEFASTGFVFKVALTRSCVGRKKRVGLKQFGKLFKKVD